MSERYKCALCMVSPGQETFYGERLEVVQHITDHGVQDKDLYLNKATTQTTLC